MKTSLIVAMAENFTIGNETGLPWHLPTDLRRFREKTWGKPIIMGRKTFELIGKPLPGRTNIVLTRNTNYQNRQVELAFSQESALELAESFLVNLNTDEVMIIGGAEIYRLFLPLVEYIYLTIVQAPVEGTARFPNELLAPGQWMVLNRGHYPADEKNVHSHWYFELKRRSNFLVEVKQRIDFFSELLDAAS